MAYKAPKAPTPVGACFRTAVLLLIAAFVPFVEASAQPPTVPPQPAGGVVEATPDDLTYTFDSDGMSLEQAIHFAKQATGKPFHYKDLDFKGKPKIMMTGIVKVPRSRAYEFWQAIFVTQGFAMVPMGPGEGDFVMVEFIANSDKIRQRANFYPVDQLERIRTKAGEVIMTTIPLKYVKVDSVRAAVSAFMNQRAAEFNAEVLSANALVVMGFAPTVYALYQVLQAMDQPTAAATLKFEMLRLEHAVAEELAPIIADLIATGQGSGGGLARPPRIVQGEQQLSPNQEKPEPKIIADPRTNSLVVYAVDSDLNEIKRLIAALDVAVSGAENNIWIYWLKNTNARDMEEILRDLLQGSTNRSQRASGIRGAGGQGGGQPTTINEAGQEVTIVADENTNALLITGSKTRYREIEPIIRELDRRRPQVLVHAAIAELSTGDLKNIAAEITAIEGGDDRYRLGGATGFGISTIAPASSITGSGTTGGTGTGGTGGGTGTGTGGGTGTGTGSGGGSDPNNPFNGLARIPFLGDGGISFQGLVAGVFERNLNVPLLVSLLQSTTKSNLLSNASVLTNDNEQSTISVGRAVPTSTNQLDPSGASRSGFGDYEEAKLELKISPHISNDNYLRLEIELTVEAFIGAVNIQSGIPPPKSTRQYIGNVTIPNGKTVVIGGLIQDNVSETVNKVPFIGDIPILGDLFKSTSTQVEKTNLYLFVTPTIFTDFKGLEDVSYEKKLEIHMLEGNIKLIDPNFRVVGLEETSVGLDAIEASGNLDLPRYVPVIPTTSPEAAGRDPGGIPVKPAGSANDQQVTIRTSGSTRFVDGQPVHDVTVPGTTGQQKPPSPGPNPR